MAIPKREDVKEGHTLVKIRVEYEWKPPLCIECHVLRHTADKFPKKPHVAPVTSVVVPDDGFITMVSRRSKSKGAATSQKKLGGGFKVNSSKNFVYQPVKPKDKDAQPSTSGANVTRKESTKWAMMNTSDVMGSQHNVDSESEVEEVFAEEDLIKLRGKGASTPSVDGFDVYVCAILESHVDNLALNNVCSKVFRHWEWSYNASLYTKGCRIILGWNKDVVDILVVAQSNQAVHAKLFHKADNKFLFCTFVYAGNKHIERRQLWVELDLHKHVVQGFPWILMGDFNVALNIKYNIASSSLMNAGMCEFKDYVKRIEVIDINSFGMHYTWNQKPKGRNGILKKFDRIMGNIDFIDMFPSAYAIFQPYRILDHSPVVLKLPSFSVLKPKPFKFYNFLAHKAGFLDLVATHWSNLVEGHSMYRVVQKMKTLKKPFRKILYEQGNLHDRVQKLRVKLDEVQKALDLDPTNDLLLATKEAEIEVIRTATNEEVTGTSVPEVFVAHYEAFLGTSTACDDLDPTGLFVTKVSKSTNAHMVSPITNEEIKRAMFDIGDDKARGPDGYTSAFFKKGWDVMGHDVCMAVHDFFVNGQLLKEVNHTFLALIPKVTTSLKVNDYRPISCCNVLYKTSDLE
ncbi:hypothetical protein Tco_1415860 [Tanacetum coccineum]